MFWGKLFEEFFENFISLVFAFTFSFCHQKEKDNKKKDCRLRSWRGCKRDPSLRSG